MTQPAAGRQARKRAPGFTLVEMMISLAIFSVVVVTGFSITIQTSSMLGDTEADIAVQNEANRAYRRLAEVLRKSGWVDRGGVTYPRTLNNGEELEFCLLSDLDKNGYAFDKTTGDLEWDPRVFTFRRDPATSTLHVYVGNVPLLVLGRHIQAVSFSTYLEDIGLNYREIRVVILAQKSGHRGEPISFTVSGSTYVRN